MFRTIDGDFVTHSIPAPGSVFLPDDQTIDPANLDVIAFIAAVVAIGTSKHGSAITEYVRGYRSRRNV